MADRHAGTIEPVPTNPGAANPPTVTVPPGVDVPRGGRLAEVLRPRRRSIAAWLGAGLVLAIVLLVALPTPRSNEVKTVDPSRSVAAARAVSGFPLYVPAPLPPGWHADSARFDRTGRIAPLLHIGYLAPDGGYAGLEETTTRNMYSFVSVMSAGAIAVGVVDVGGVQWVEEQSERKPQTSLVRYFVTGAVLVTGTTSLSNLETLAASLHVH